LRANPCLALPIGRIGRFCRERRSSNIIFILADDLGPGGIRMLRRQLGHTPNIDQSQKKASFEQYYVRRPFARLRDARSSLAIPSALADNEPPGGEISQIAARDG